MIIKRGDSYTNDVGNTSSNWRELVEVREDDPYGRIVFINEIDRERGRMETVSVEWYGPEPGKIDIHSILSHTKGQKINLDPGGEFWLGQLHLAVLDNERWEYIVYPINGRTSQRINLALWRVRRRLNTIEERLRWTAAVWRLIDAPLGTVPEWGNLRPYRWLRGLLTK